MIRDYRQTHHLCKDAVLFNDLFNLLDTHRRADEDLQQFCTILQSISGILLPTFWFFSMPRLSNTSIVGDALVNVRAASDPRLSWLGPVEMTAIIRAVRPALDKLSQSRLYPCRETPHPSLGPLSQIHIRSAFQRHSLV